MSSVITARLDEGTLELVDRVAKAHGRSRSWFAAQAIKQAAEAEAELLAFIQEGVESAEREDLVVGDQIFAVIDRWVAEFGRECP